MTLVSDGRRDGFGAAYFDISFTPECRSATLGVVHTDPNSGQSDSFTIWATLTDVVPWEPDEPEPDFPNPPEGVPSIVGDGRSASMALGSSIYVRPAIGGTQHRVCVQVTAWRPGGLFPSGVDIWVRNAATGEVLASQTGLTTMFTGSSQTWVLGPITLGPWEAALLRVDEGIPAVSRWEAEVYSVALDATSC